MKSSVDGIRKRIEENGERISELEKKTIQSEQQRLNRLKTRTEQKIKICVIRAWDREEKEGRTKNILQEIIAENVPNLAKIIKIQTQESAQTSYRIRPKNFMPNIIIKLLKALRKK